MNGRIKRLNNTGIQLPRIGFVKCGFTDAKGYPRSTDYFIPTGNYSTYFDTSFGEKPKTIQVVFLEDDPEKVCNERYEIRDSKGKLFASGDGVNFKVWTGENYKEYSEVEHPGLMERIHQKAKSKKGWEVVLTLRFLIPKIKGVAGLWEFTTKGEASTIPNIRGTFDTLTEKRGFVKGIMFDLSVDFAKSQKPGKTTRYPVVSLIPNQSEQNLKEVQENFLIPSDIKSIES